MGDINKEVIALLDKYGDDYKRALKENKRLEYLYALSVLRENLLEWYDFQTDGSLLQVGADFGALTGLFTRRAGRVTVLDESEESLAVVKKRFGGRDNVDFALGDLMQHAERVRQDGSDGKLPGGGQAGSDGRGGNLPGGGQAGSDERGGQASGYDVITLIGSLKAPYEAQIQAARELLLPGGTLIAAACNQFGMKYWAGARRDVYCVTKRELSELLPDGAFYYPMPDYRLPSVIYSDKYLPKKGDLTGMPALYDYPEYLLMDVGEAYDAVCEDGRFADFANSFLVIWKKGE